MMKGRDVYDRSRFLITFFFLLPPHFSALQLAKDPPKDKQDFNRF